MLILQNGKNHTSPLFLLWEEGVATQEKALLQVSALLYIVFLPCGQVTTIKMPFSSPD